MPPIDWAGVPVQVIAAVIAAVASLIALQLGARLAAAAKLRERTDAAEVQREVDDHNDILTFRRELQEENSRRLDALRHTESLVRDRETEVNGLRLLLVTEREAHGTRVAELERKLDLAEHALKTCRDAYTALSNKQMEE